MKHCRLLGNDDLPLPIHPCPLDFIMKLDEWYLPPVKPDLKPGEVDLNNVNTPMVMPFRESSFLDRAPPEVKNSVARVEVLPAGRKSTTAPFTLPKGSVDVVAKTILGNVKERVLEVSGSVTEAFCGFTKSSEAVLFNKKVRKMLTKNQRICHMEGWEERGRPPLKNHPDAEQKGFDCVYGFDNVPMYDEKQKLPHCQS